MFVNNFSKFAHAWKKQILTSNWCAKHLSAGWNTQNSWSNFIFSSVYVYSLPADYLVPNIGTAVWLLYIISQVDAIYIVMIIMAITYLVYLRYFPKVRDRYHWWCTLDFIWHIRFVLEDIKKQCKNPLIWQFFKSFWGANNGSLNIIPSKFWKKLF